MPCDLLVVAHDDFTHPDPAIELAGCQKKGDIERAERIGFVWGTKEQAPLFVHVLCPDLDLAVAQDRCQRWEYAFDFEILQRSVPLDGWRFKVVNLTRRVIDNAASLDVEQIRDFFEHWSAIFIRMDPDGVVLDWTVGVGALSKGFLGDYPSALGLVIAETAYDAATGWHIFSIDWSGATFPQPAIQLRKRIEMLGGEVLSAGPFTGTYRLHRDGVRQAFVDDIKGHTLVYRYRRYSFPPADVDTALAMGGTVTLTAAQIAARVIDARA